MNPYPSARRTYALRSRIRCKLCKQRMCGITRTHPDREHGDYAYYICQFDPGNPRHVAAAPDHPRTVAAREDLLLDALRDGLFTYALGPGRAEHLAELLPADATAKQAQSNAQAAASRTDSDRETTKSLPSPARPPAGHRVDDPALTTALTQPAELGLRA